MNTRSDIMERHNTGSGLLHESNRADDMLSTRAAFAVADCADSATEMDRSICTRAELVTPSLAGKPVVLLTGPWPHGPSKSVIELDQVLDRRYLQLDREAERLVELAGGEGDRQEGPLPLAWVNALGLRYYLVKLLRVVEFFTQVQPPRQGERIGLVADRADRDDVALISTICQRAGASCTVQWNGQQAEPPAPAVLQEEWWRRTLRHLAYRLRRTDRSPDAHPRVILCGNPRFLDPVCQVLHERNCHLWWLYDRFAVKPFFQWHAKGIHQLTCQENAAPGPHEDSPVTLPPLVYRGIDLRPIVAEWLTQRLAQRKRDQRRWEDQIAAHFQRIRPHLLVMEEDATPMKRIALALARRCGAQSFVVQHGAPVARFGFAPLAADGFFAWGHSTREQLERWEIPTERIFVTGSPVHDRLHECLRGVSRKGSPGGSPRILLLATVPPRDHRPDVIEMNLNSRTYAEMIEAAFGAVESLPGATLIIKPHPRTKNDPIIQAARARHPNLRVETAPSPSLAESLRGVDCVLSCLSSAGIEATLAGIPVVQLVPRGAGEILPAERWGLLGSASDSAQLRPLINKGLCQSDTQDAGDLGSVFANASFWGRQSAKAPDAATRIAEILLGHGQTDKKKLPVRSTIGDGWQVRA